VTSSRRSADREECTGVRFAAHLSFVRRRRTRRSWSRAAASPAVRSPSTRPGGGPLA